MKIVRWEPQERVDLPDLTSLSHFLLGEFRRTVRTLIQGEVNDDSGDPSYVPQVLKGLDSRIDGTNIYIDIEYDKNGDPVAVSGLPAVHLGVAILGDPTIDAKGIDFIDAGNLTGDHGFEGPDSALGLEGNPSGLIVPFAGQPANTYAVWLEFQYANAELDNRAFWNPGTNEEYVDQIDTRAIPALVIGRATSFTPAEDKLLICAVDWSGAALSNLLDGRILALEGWATFGYQFTTQNLPEEVYDFDRGTDRGNSSVGISAIWPALRALQRQISDIKGQNNSGLFDWFSRVLRYGGATAPDIVTNQTRSLQTLDTMTITVADDSDTYGDFNNSPGVNGLTECLDWLETNQSNLPYHLKILLKSSNPTPTSFSVFGAYNFTEKHIEIIGQTGDAVNTDAKTLVIAPTSEDPLLDIVNGSLTLRNVSILATGNIINMRPDGSTHKTYEYQIFRAENSAIVTSVLGTGTYAVKAPGSKAIVQSTVFGGSCYFGGGRPLPGMTTPSAVGAQGGTFDNCEFLDAHIILRRVEDTTSLAYNDYFYDVLDSAIFRNCHFVDRATNQVARTHGIIDMRGCANIRFENCFFNWSADSDCVRLGNLDFLDIGVKVTQKIVFEQCRFAPQDADHTAYAGVGGANGTGWAINLLNDSAPASVLEIPQNISIRNCDFNETFAVAPSEDALGIQLQDAKVCTIENCQFSVKAHTGGQIHIVRVKAGSLALRNLGANQNILIKNCRFADNVLQVRGAVGATLQWYRGIEIQYGKHITIEDCIFENKNLDDTVGAINDAAQTGLTQVAGAISFTDNCLYLKITNNHFENWEADSSIVNWGSKSCCIIAGNSSVLLASIISENTFHDFSGSAIDLKKSGADSILCSFINNNFRVLTDADFLGCIILAATATKSKVNGNHWVYEAGSVVPIEVIDVGIGTELSLVGNSFLNGKAVAHAGVGVSPTNAVGWDETPDFNLFNAYDELV